MAGVAVRRIEGGRYAPGVSGNPNGKPKVPEELKRARMLAAEHGPAAVRALLDMIESAEGKVRIAAIRELREWADRACADDSQSAAQLTLGEQRRMLSTALQAVDAELGKAGA